MAMSITVPMSRETARSLKAGDSVLLSGVMIAIIVLLVKSTYGRAFIAIRDDEVAAQAMGINLAKHKRLAFVISSFFAGVGGICPAVIMILMASSIKYTLEEAKVLDTLLHGAVELAQSMPRWTVILFIYAMVLVMNFFIPSGSAKAFMLIPLIVPMAQLFGISRQLCVVAFAFGDGFSNVFYPTNPALLISLGLADVSYSDWFRWSWKFQALNLLLTTVLLLFGLWIGY